MEGLGHGLRIRGVGICSLPVPPTREVARLNLLSVDPHEGEAEAIALAAEPNADTQSISRKTRTDSIACGIDRMLTVKLG